MGSSTSGLFQFAFIAIATETVAHVRNGSIAAWAFSIKADNKRAITANIRGAGSQAAI